MCRIGASRTLLSVLCSFSFDWATALVSVYYDSSQSLHRDLLYHPEQSERISKCVEAIEKKYSSTEKTIKLIDCAPVDLRSATRSGFTESLPFTQSELDHALGILLQTHEADMVLKLQEKTRLAKAKRLTDGKAALGHVSGDANFAECSSVSLDGLSRQRYLRNNRDIRCVLKMHCRVDPGHR